MALLIADPEKLTRVDADGLINDGQSDRRNDDARLDEVARRVPPLDGLWNIRRPLERRAGLGCRRGNRKGTGDHRKGDPPLPELGAILDERCTYFDRDLQADAPQESN